MTTGRINQVAILQTPNTRTNKRTRTKSRIQRTGSRRFKPEGAQAETRSVFSTNVETRASRQVSRALRSGHDQIDASPVAFLLFSLGLPAQSDIRETQRGSTRPFTVAGTIAGSGSVQDQTLGAWRARSDQLRRTTYPSHAGSLQVGHT